MATGNTEYNSGICPHCQTRLKLERNGMVWGLGDFIMVWMTAGIWIILRFLMRPAWRCSVCGVKVKPSKPPKMNIARP